VTGTKSNRPKGRFVTANYRSTGKSKLLLSWFGRWSPAVLSRLDGTGGGQICYLRRNLSCFQTRQSFIAYAICFAVTRFDRSWPSHGQHVQTRRVNGDSRMLGSRRFELAQNVESKRRTIKRADLAREQRRGTAERAVKWPRYLERRSKNLGALGIATLLLHASPMRPGLSTSPGRRSCKCLEFQVFTIAVTRTDRFHHQISSFEGGVCSKRRNRYKRKTPAAEIRC